MPGYELFGEEERQAIQELLMANGGVLAPHGFDGIRNGIYRVREFEDLVGAYCGSPYAQAVSSGTAALRVALQALGIGPGDEVIIPAFTFVATAEAVVDTGAALVVVDIDDSFNICPKALSSAISERTRAVIVVHMMGAPAEMSEVIEVAKDADIRVVEDAAQAFGANYKGSAVGTIGDIGCFSFDGGKAITTGEGGMIVTSDEALFVRCRALHDHGHEYSTTDPRGSERALCAGFNFRMTEVQAAIGVCQLGKFDHMVSNQRKNKLGLKRRLHGHGLDLSYRRVLDPGEIADTLVLRVADRATANSLALSLQTAGIGTKNLPDAVRWHFAKYWEHLFLVDGQSASRHSDGWPKTEEILDLAVAIPIGVKMTEESLDSVALTVAEGLGAGL